jgi:NAD+ kinase
MKVGLILHPRPRSLAFAREFSAAAGAAGLTLVGSDDLRLAGIAAEEGDPEIMVAIGGDGTTLSAVRRAIEADVPVIGFNLGTLGFLAQAEPSDLREVVERIASGVIEVEERMTVQARLDDGTPATGVNDVVTEKIESQRLVDLEAFIDGSRFLTYRADGLVVSTPTGSTAYNFSAGGPLVDPKLDVLLLTPVAAHSLFSRTIVVPADNVLELRVLGERPVRVSVDGREVGGLEGNQRVTVQRGVRPARFMVLRGRPFPETVTEKFHLI